MYFEFIVPRFIYFVIVCNIFLQSKYIDYFLAPPKKFDESIA